MLLCALRGLMLGFVGQTATNYYNGSEKRKEAP